MKTTGVSLALGMLSDDLFARGSGQQFGRLSRVAAHEHPAMREFRPPSLQSESGVSEVQTRMRFEVPLQIRGRAIQRGGAPRTKATTIATDAMARKAPRPALPQQ